MSFYELTTEERLQVGIKDNLIRYSVGIEDAEDLDRRSRRCPRKRVMHSAGPLSFIIHGRVIEEQASPVVGNGPVP